MGASFTNVQVQVAGGDEKATRAAVIAAIREVARADGHEEVDDGDDAERVVAIAGDRRWIAVYDQATEDQDGERLERLAKALSRATGGAAVSVLVHDSDATYLHLYQAGVARDAWCNDPGWFGPVDPREKARLAGRPEAWRDAIGGVAPAKLRAAWATSHVLAERYVDDVGAMLGWDRERASVGYQYLMEDPPPRLVRLAFRDRAQQAATAPATGPIELVMGSAAPGHASDAGQPISLHVSPRNQGRGGRGLRVEVRGSVVDDGVVAFDEAELWVGGSRERRRVPLVRDRDALVAQLDDFELPAGVSDWRAAMGAGRDGYQAVFATQVTAQIHGRALTRGDGTASIALVPVERPAGRFELELDVRVGGARPMPRLPGMPRMTVSERVTEATAAPKPKATAAAKPKAAKPKTKAAKPKTKAAKPKTKAAKPRRR